MLKNILNLEGVQKLNKTQQNSVKGNGIRPTCNSCEVWVFNSCQNICL